MKYRISVKKHKDLGWVAAVLSSDTQRFVPPKKFRHLTKAGACDLAERWCTTQEAKDYQSEEYRYDTSKDLQ